MPKHSIVTQCSMPANCAFSRERTKFYYWDSFEACLNRPELSMSDIYECSRGEEDLMPNKALQRH